MVERKETSLLSDLQHTAEVGHREFKKLGDLWDELEKLARNTNVTEFSFRFEPNRYRNGTFNSMTINGVIKSDKNKTLEEDIPEDEDE